MLNMECALCDSIMNEEKRELQITRDGYTLKLSGITAYVCPNCGNIEYMAKDIKMAEKLCMTLSQANIDLKEEYLNVTDMAEELNVTNQTIYNMIKDGRLKPIKIGKEWRFYKKDIDIIKNTISNDDFQLAARNLDGKLSNEDIEIIKKEMEDD